MEYKNYYDVLGVERSYTQDQIKSAYRKLARKYHPDLNKEEDAETKFKEIGEAFEVLGDVEKRAAYDQLGKSYQAGQDFSPPPDWNEGFEFRGHAASENDPRFSEFFENLFGQAYQEQRREHARAQFNIKGQDHHARISIDLMDAFQGAKREIVLKVPELTSDGHVTLKERRLMVAIPKGVKAGQHIRLNNQGSPGQGEGKPGDLFLEIAFKPHPLYHVEGRDLYLNLPVAPWEAALGGKIKIPTPEGVVDLTVPSGSQQGRKLRLKGRGLPAPTPGDLYVVLQISLPAAEDDKTKELYKAMEENFDFNPREAMLKTARVQ